MILAMNRNSIVTDCTVSGLWSLGRSKLVRVVRVKDPRVHSQERHQSACGVKLALEIIPQDPMRLEYRQGATLGDEYKHWFRAKCFQQYRLFFRYDRESRILIYAWVNDEDTQRAYESDTSAYPTFRRILKSGKRPDEWNVLLSQPAPPP